jgi:hypothetical protein
LTDSVASQLKDKTISIFHKTSNDSVSIVLVPAFPIKAIHNFFPRIRGVLQKSPSAKHYNITGGSAEAYKAVFDQITRFCKDKKVTEFSRNTCIAYAHLASATTSLSMTYFTNEYRGRMTSMAATPLQCKHHQTDLRGIRRGRGGCLGARTRCERQSPSSNIRNPPSSQ